MAIVSKIVGTHSLIPNRERQSAWYQAFDEPTRLSQLRDDAVAWRTVTGILISIVTIGMLIAIAVVAAVSR